jgi:eukaryotic-like serine/threonine-protein kinase
VKLCQTCGEVYPDQAERCPSHGGALLDWAEVSDVRDATRTTDADAVGAFSDTAPVGRGNDLTDPEVPLYAAPTPPSSVMLDPSLRPESPRPARVLGGRYRLGEHIGIGGYGVVFAAFDLRLGKRVAVKVLSPAVVQDPEIVRRFEREAIAAGRVRHECIVDVTDYAVDPSGTSFIVMEYLGGADLGALIAEVGALEPARALAIAAQCASALTATHGAGILHRDLKPSNVFLVASPSRPDFVKIIDFGIAKITNDGQFSSVTSASKVVGTPHYMAPEQARGLELDGRADVYALGVILFEMLTGERPFSGASAIEILTNAMNSSGVAPSSRNPALARIPDLDRLVLRAMAANRRRRFDSMQAFGDALMSCLSRLEPERALPLPAIAHDPGDTTAVRRAPPDAPTARDPVAPTTLEGSSGELTGAVRIGGRHRTVVVATAAVAAAAVAAVMLLRPGGDRMEPPAAPPPASLTASAPAPPTPADVAPADAMPASPDTAPPPQAHVIRVTSSPAGAVVRSRDRGQLGVTPLEVTLPADAGGDQLSVSHPGRVTRTITIDRTTEPELAIELESRPVRRAPPSPPEPAPEPLGIKDW